MSNDDLGQFPTPSDPTTAIPPVDPSVTQPVSESFSTPPVMNTPPMVDTFEETPDEIPSISTPPVTSPVSEPEMQEAPEPTPPAPRLVPPREEFSPMPALPPTPPPTLVVASVPTPKGGSAFGSLIAVILLLISGVALAVTVFLFSQSQQLRQQLAEVTQTLEQQRTTVTPTPTPTIIDFPTPTPTPEATESGLVTTPSPTPTATPSTTTAMPLADATKALKVAINHLPNAQMIIIKTENATSPTLASTKYFFRQDLTTKKYFYVLITGAGEPEIIDKAIYVTPDNNIPSLNDLIQGNTMGVDIDEAITIANSVCSSQVCATAMVKGQYIKSGDSVIWQLSFDPVDAAKSQLIIQINALTKEVLYKSTGF